MGTHGGLFCYFLQSFVRLLGWGTECGLDRVSPWCHAAIRRVRNPGGQASGRRIEKGVGDKPARFTDGVAVEMTMKSRHRAVRERQKNQISGEPAGGDARPTGVTEAFAAGTLLPEMMFAPRVDTAQARAESVGWDASDIVTTIYKEHYGQLVRLALLLLHDLSNAEEVVQEAFIAMHQAEKRLRDSEKALAYLRQTVVNRSRSVLRHRKVVDMHAPKAAPDEPSAEYAALLLMERSAVVSALRLLPDRQREAVVLRYYGDLSEADIAQAMGISRGAVKSHTARAIAALRNTLGQETTWRGAGG